MDLMEIRLEGYGLILWTEFIWLRIGTSGRLLWTR